MPPNFYFATVFGAPDCVGNPTAVVLGEPAAPHQEIAARLGTPDTVFITPEKGRAGWATRVFSPGMELTMCFQGILAADAALRLTSGEDAKDTVFNTQVGPVQAGDVPDVRDGFRWVKFPKERMQKLPPVVSLEEFARAHGAVARDVSCLSTGRVRAYGRLRSVEELDELVLPPQEVLRFCVRQRVDGLCFVALAADHVRIRVFTTSLDGNEDIATGGAVCGLAMYLEMLGDAPPTQPYWTVRQGSGSARRRGKLYLWAEGAAPYIAVGGNVLMTARGLLSQE